MTLSTFLHFSSRRKLWISWYKWECGASKQSNVSVKITLSFIRMLYYIKCGVFLLKGWYSEQEMKVDACRLGLEMPWKQGNYQPVKRKCSFRKSPNCLSRPFDSMHEGRNSTWRPMPCPTPKILVRMTRNVSWVFRSP